MTSQSKNKVTNKIIRFRQLTTVLGLFWLLVLYLGAHFFDLRQWANPALYLGLSVLGGVVILIRIMDLVTANRAGLIGLSVLRVGFLWFLKLVCWGIFAITLKSHSEIPVVMVVLAIMVLFAPLSGLAIKDK